MSRYDRLPDSLRALRHPNFRLFFGGQLVSLTGTWMQQIALSWLVYRMSGSAVLLGTIGFVSQLPVTLLTPFAGALADRHDRRKILLVSQGASMFLAALLAGLALSGHVQIWHLFAIGVLNGLCSALDTPARQAIMVDLVGREDVPNAIALNASIFHASRVVGPALAGFLVSMVGEGWCFALNALSFVAVLVGLTLMRIHFVPRPHKDNAFQSILEGFRYVAHHRQIRSLMILVATVSLFGMGYMVLMPILADQVLHGGARGMGILMAMSGLGSVISALELARHKDPSILPKRIGYASLAFGASLVAFSFSRNFWISGVLLIPVGYSMVAQMAAANTVVQSLVSEEFRGRVMSVFVTLFMGLMPFGALIAGHLGEYIGTMQTVGLGGVATLIAGAIYLRSLQTQQHSR